MAPEKVPAFQFYPKDFLTDERVRLMSHTERGIYVTLLCLCWLERSLPADPAHLAKLVDVTATRFARIWAGPLSACFHEDAGRLHHKRLNHERDKQEIYRQRQREKGHRSAEARFNRGSTGGQPIARAPVQPDVNSPISDLRSPVQTSSMSGPAKKPPDPHVREFLTWFQAEYTKRRHGAEYLVKWNKHGALVKQMLGATTLDRLQKYAQILLSDKTEDEFIVNSDRGIEVLSARFSWLSDRLSTWEASRA